MTRFEGEGGGGVTRMRHYTPLNPLTRLPFFSPRVVHGPRHTSAVVSGLQGKAEMAGKMNNIKNLMKIPQANYKLLFGLAVGGAGVLYGANNCYYTGAPSFHPSPSCQR